MASSSLHQWESDPLLSAAEIVQDSADRVESIFHLLLHEQSLVPDSKLLASMDYHRRDLATTLETAKWQLEDFEREVSPSAMKDESQIRQNVISRHRQFIRAIREQIHHVESSLDDTSVGNSVRNTEWINMNEQDKRGLALFLSGGKPVEPRNDSQDSSISMQFLDPTASSSFNDEIVDPDNVEAVNLSMNGFMHLDHNFNLEENKLRKVDAHYSTQMGFQTPFSIQEATCNEHDEDGSWDLEANEAKAKSFFHKNRLRGYYGRMNFFVPLVNLLSYGCKDNRSFTKRWKDGEEQRHSSSHIDISHAEQVLAW